MDITVSNPYDEKRWWRSSEHPTISVGVSVSPHLCREPYEELIDRARDNDAILQKGTGSKETISEAETSIREYKAAIEDMRLIDDAIREAGYCVDNVRLVKNAPEPHHASFTVSRDSMVSIDHLVKQFNRAPFRVVFTPGDTERHSQSLEYRDTGVRIHEQSFGTGFHDGEAYPLEVDEQIRGEIESRDIPVERVKGPYQGVDYCVGTFPDGTRHSVVPTVAGGDSFELLDMKVLGCDATVAVAADDEGEIPAAFKP